MQKSIALLALAALTLFACSKKEKEQDKTAPKGGAPAAKAKASVGANKIPAFSIPSLWGGMCNNDAIKGKPAIVEVWSYRCPHCIKMAKELETVAETLDFSKYAIVSIHARGGKGAKGRIEPHFKNKKIHVCMDNGSFIKSLAPLPKKYQVRGIPHLFFVNSKGEISEVLRGRRPAKMVKAKLEALK